ncbi:hypothetical protein HY523_02905 [Candidatus Berkelbacteria bacterium]|nr:hypothetical protein [Candidatus Berkelbacteria bacterium]
MTTAAATIESRPIALGRVVIPRTRFYRFLEILPGALTWGTFVGAIALAIWQPILLANLILLYDIFWLYRSVRFAAYLLVAFRNMRREIAMNWRERFERRETRWQRGLQADQVWQAVILLHSKESYDLLETSIASYAAADYPLQERLIVILASEERAGEIPKEAFARLQKKFGGAFALFHQTIHPAHLPGEIISKSANATWAAEWLERYCQQHGIDPRQMLVHNFDADTRVHPQYFARVGVAFLETPINAPVSYQPFHIYSNNIWDTPAIIRIIATSSTMIFLHNTLRQHRLRNFSSRSDCFQTILDIRYWAPDAIPEDSRQYWDSFYTYHGRLTIRPIYVPLRMDAVLAHDYFRTIQNQYQQLRRWAWGVVDFPYTVIRAIQDRTIGLPRKVVEIGRLLDSHYSWANSSLIITVYGWLPYLLNRNFHNTVLGQRLPQLTQIILTLAIVGLFATIWLSFLMYQPRPHHHPRWAWAKFLFQWLLMPIASVAFSSAAAIDAQTRLMLGRYLEYQIAEKVVRHRPHPSVT